MYQNEAFFLLNSQLNLKLQELAQLAFGAGLWLFGWLEASHEEPFLSACMLVGLPACPPVFLAF